jgi:hypothetical protein
MDAHPSRSFAPTDVALVITALQYRLDLVNRERVVPGWSSEDRARLRGIRVGYLHAIKLLQELQRTGSIRDAAIGGPDALVDAIRGLNP